MECSFSIVSLIYYAYNNSAHIVPNILVAIGERDRSMTGESFFATKRPAASPSLLCQATGT